MLVVIAFALVLLLSNAITFWCVKRHFVGRAESAETLAQAANDARDSAKEDAKKATQALADISYRCKELEKDLAAAKRRHE